MLRVDIKCLTTGAPGSGQSPKVLGGERHLGARAHACHPDRWEVTRSRASPCGSPGASYILYALCFAS